MFSKGDDPKFKIDTDVHKADRSNTIFEHALVMLTTVDRTIKIWDASAYTEALASMVIGSAKTMYPYHPRYEHAVYDNTHSYPGDEYSYDPSNADHSDEIAIYTGGQCVLLYAAEECKQNERFMATDLGDHTGTIPGTHDGMISPINESSQAEKNVWLGWVLETTPLDATYDWAGIGGTEHKMSLKTGTAIGTTDHAMSVAGDEHPSVNYNGKWPMDDYHPRIKCMYK